MIRASIVAVAIAAVASAQVRSAVAQPDAQPQPPPDQPAATGPTVVILRLDRGPGVDVALSERVQKEIEDQARKSGMQVTVGTENLTDTAAVAGCTAKVPADCRQPIIDALGVDEIVYGSVDRSLSSPHVTVERAKKGVPVADKISVDVPDNDNEGAARALHPALDGLFGTSITGTTETTTTFVPETQPTQVDRPSSVNTKKVLFIGGVSLGGAMVVTGLACWFKTSSLNSDIDAAPNNTIDDIDNLRRLEDRAGSYATWGNVLVFLGLAVGGGTAAWWYYKGRKSEAPRAIPTGPAPEPSATPTPTAWITPESVGLTLTWSTR